MSAIRKLAAEAADNGLLAPELAAGISRVKSAKTQGIRTGNWLSQRQAQALLSAPNISTVSYRGDVERNTFRKYNSSLTLLASFCDKRAIPSLISVGVEALEDFRRSRKIGSVTWKVERQTLIAFFDYCVKRRWITTNPARELEAPRNLKPNDVVPYTLKEEGQILAACERIGGGVYNRSGAKYEQHRARAMVIHRAPYL